MTKYFTIKDFTKEGAGYETWEEYKDPDVTVTIRRPMPGGNMGHFSKYTAFAPAYYITILIEGITNGVVWVVDDKYEPVPFETEQEAIDALNDIWSRLEDLEIIENGIVY